MNREYSVSDEALIKAAQRGDREAAAWLYHRHVEKVHRICYRIVMDSSQVQDCVQEVWLKVFRSLDRFRLGRSFAAWLNTVAAHTAIDYYRRWIKQRNRLDIHKTHVKALATDQQPGSHSSDEALIQQKIQEALEEISVNQRAAFTLRYFEEMPTADIARVLGCAEGTVRVHIRRSLLALRARLAGKLNQ
ncbi:RNA polymerase sigma factor [Planctomycetota bacterium]